MSLFNKVKIKVKAKRNVGLQNKNYQRRSKERSAVVVGNRLVSVDGQLFEANFSGNIGDTVTVTNVGTPAAALYAQSTTGATSANSSSSSNVTIVSDGALATIQAHQGLGYVEGHTTSPASREFYSIKYGIVGGVGVDESNNIIYMLNTIGANGGGKAIIAAADGVSPIQIDKLVSIYYSNIDLEFRSPLLFGAAAGIRIMGAMDEFVRTATNAGGLASDTAEGDTTIPLATSLTKMQASHFVDGDLITIRGQNGADGNALEKQIVTVISRNTGTNVLTISEELEEDFLVTYPLSEWEPSPGVDDNTTIYVNRAGSFTANVLRGAMAAEVTNIANFAVGDLVRVYDSRNENDMNASAIRGSGLPYENVCNLEYVKIADIVPDGVDPTKGTVTFDQPLSKSYLFGSPYFGGIAKVLPVRNVRIHGARISYYEDQVSKNAHAISINFAEDCQIYDCTVDGIYGYQMTGDEYDHDVDGFLIPYGRMGQAIRISDSFNCWVYDCRINGAAHTGSGSGYGFANYKSTNCGVYNTVATGCRHNFLMQASTKWSVINCQSWDDGISGIDVHGALEVDGLIAGNILHRSTRHTDDASNGAMIRLGNTSHTVGCHHVVVQDNWCYGNGETNIAAIDFLPASTYLTIEGNKIHGGYYGIKNSKNPSQCNPTQTASHIVIRNNDLYDITNRAIYLEGIPDTATSTRSSGKADYVLVENNATWNCEQHYHVSGGDAITNLTVSKNRAIDPITSPANDYYGLVVTDVAGLMVDDNNFHLCSRGISLTDATSAVITKNTLTATIDATPITLAGTNTGPGGGALIYVANIVDNSSVGGSASPDFTSDVSITGTDPQLTFIESDGTADNKRWDLLANGDGFFIRVVNDAASAAANIMAVQRTANTIDSIDLTATNINLNGIVNLSGGSSAFTSNPVVTNAAPSYVWVETGVTANNTRWDIVIDNMVQYYRVVNDAASSATAFMYVGRSANTVTSVDLAATAINLGGEVTATGDITVSNANPQLLLNETGVTADNRLWDFLADGMTLFFRTVNDAKSSASTWLSVVRSGLTVTAVNIAATAINLAGNVITDGYMRSRQNGNTRYRSDHNVSGAIVTINGYDDTGAAYIPGVLEFSTLSVRPSGGASVADFTSTGLAITGNYSVSANQTHSSGGQRYFWSSTAISPGTTVDALPNLAARITGVDVSGFVRNTAGGSSNIHSRIVSGTPLDVNIGGDVLRITNSAAGKISFTHFTNVVGGTFCVAVDIVWI
jgi:hypothetical protein